MVITLNVYQGEIFLINGGKKVELVVDERKEFWKIKKYKFKPYLTNQILSKTNYSQVSLCVEPETENFDDVTNFLNLNKMKICNLSPPNSKISLYIIKQTNNKKKVYLI